MRVKLIQTIIADFKVEKLLHTIKTQLIIKILHTIWIVSKGEELFQCKLTMLQIKMQWKLLLINLACNYLKFNII